MPFVQRGSRVHGVRNRRDSADHARCGEEAPDTGKAAPARRLLRQARARGDGITERRGAVMNGRSASMPAPTPGPFCAVYSPLLPLLGALALTPETEASLREHLVDCAW